MALEDRSSPNTATSPCTSDSGGNFNTPNSPESTRTSPYTCMTISNSQDGRTFSTDSEPSSPKSFVMPKVEQPERTFFRITSFALPSPKEECDRESPVHYRSPSPMNSVAFSVSPPPSNEPAIQTLKYSIRNILQPDFGKNAVQKSKSPPKISFRPYESLSSMPKQHKTPKKSFGIAPLGSLCQAVSQIGSTNTTNQLTTLSGTINGTSLQSKRPPSPELNTSNLPNTDDVKKDEGNVPKMWPAWVYCTRYSDRPSSGPRSRRMKKLPSEKTEDKRPRTAFSSAQLARLKQEFTENRYLTESRRQKLSNELGLNEAQIKIWFQNKRAKIKKSSGHKNALALQLMAQGLYNHTTVACDEEDNDMSLSC